MGGIRAGPSRRRIARESAGRPRRQISPDSRTPKSPTKTLKMPPVSDQQKLEQAMSEMFKTLDRNKDNKINKEELKVLIGKVFGSKPNEVPPQLVDFVMKEADKDKSGAISEDELKHALSCLTGIAIMLTLTEEFKKIDTDKNGYLTKNELEALVKGKAKGKGGDNVKALLGALDMDGDGKVTLEEFLTVCCQGLVAQGQ